MFSILCRVVLNHEETKTDAQRITKFQPFIEN